MEDSKIIELFFSRDQEAIAQVDRTYGRKLFHISDNILRCFEDAQECVNDTYLKTWDTIPPKRPQSLFGYLAKICRNLSLNKLDWLNAAKRKTEVVSLTQEMESCIPSAYQDATLEARELGRQLNQFLATLTPENRMIFVRRYWYVDTVADIAVRYSLNEAAVNTRLHRLRKKLADYLAKEGIAV